MNWPAVNVISDGLTRSRSSSRTSCVRSVTRETLARKTRSDMSFLRGFELLRAPPAGLCGKRLAVGSASDTRAHSYSICIAPRSRGAKRRSLTPVRRCLRRARRAEPVEPHRVRAQDLPPGLRGETLHRGERLRHRPVKVASECW